MPPSQVSGHQVDRHDTTHTRWTNQDSLGIGGTDSTRSPFPHKPLGLLHHGELLRPELFAVPTVEYQQTNLTRQFHELVDAAL